MASFNIKTEVSEFNAAETNRCSCDIFSAPQEIQLNTKQIASATIQPKKCFGKSRVKITPRKKHDDTTKDDDSADVLDDEEDPLESSS